MGSPAHPLMYILMAKIHSLQRLKKGRAVAILELTQACGFKGHSHKIAFVKSTITLCLAFTSLYQYHNPRQLPLAPTLALGLLISYPLFLFTFALNLINCPLLGCYFASSIRALTNTFLIQRCKKLALYLQQFLSFSMHLCCYLEQFLQFFNETVGNIFHQGSSLVLNSFSQSVFKLITLSITYEI